MSTQTKNPLRRELVLSQAWASFASISVASCRAEDGSTRWAIAWLIAALLLAILAILNWRDGRQ